MGVITRPESDSRTAVILLYKTKQDIRIMTKKSETSNSRAKPNILLDKLANFGYFYLQWRIISGECSAMIGRQRTNPAEEP